MRSKIQTAIWFAQRPAFWRHAGSLVARKFSPDLDSPRLRQQATAWARERAVQISVALNQTGLLQPGEDLPVLPRTVVQGAETLAASAQYRMGGAGDLNLIYASTMLVGAKSAVETGVAYGWSSLAILAAMQRTGGKLASVDMPYVKAGNERWVGVVVPQDLRQNWTLIREPDRNGLLRALAKFPRGIDVAHYDSDKSYAGRMFAYPKLWSALTPGGVFLSDDIQDNFAFAHFIEQVGADFAVTESDGKFAAVARKR